MQKKAVVLLNMGGPNSLDEAQLFLHNMFNDPNIITTKSPILRRLIASMIVTFRTKKAQANYARLGGKSPLVGYTQKLVDKLQKALPDRYITFAMRYTPPFCEGVIQELQEQGIQDVVLLPLYPHYSTTTTKSSLEDFDAIATKCAYHPKLTKIERFYDNTTYNHVLVQTIKEALGDNDPSTIDLIFSAHSLPQKIVDKGDPYQHEIHSHVTLLKELLLKEGVVFRDIHLAYQSKLGPIKWLEPSLKNTLKSLENKNALIVPLSFSLDNSETEFELSMEYQELAHTLGFERYLVAKCPNDKDDFVACLKALVLDVSGWR